MQNGSLSDVESAKLDILFSHFGLQCCVRLVVGGFRVDINWRKNRPSLCILSMSMTTFTALSISLSIEDVVYSPYIHQSFDQSCAYLNVHLLPEFGVITPELTQRCIGGRTDMDLLGCKGKHIDMAHNNWAEMRKCTYKVFFVWKRNATATKANN